MNKRMSKLKNCLLAIITATTLSCQTLPFVKEPSLSEARGNPSIRQNYLNDLLTKIDKRLCEGVIYDVEGSNVHDNEYASTLGTFLDDKLEKQTIYVGKSAFENNLLIKTNEDMRYLIEVHEYRHVMQNIEGMGKFSSPTLIKAYLNNELDEYVLHIAGELEAYHYGLKKIISGESRVNPFLERHQKLIYSLYFEKLLSSIDNSSKFQEEFIFDILRNVQDLPPQENPYIFKLLFSF